MTDLKSTIKSWLLNVVNDGSWQRFNDLHIDKISTVFPNKASWFTGGIECYIQAKTVIEELDLPYTVELAFPLKSKKTKIDHLITSVSSLYKNYDDTPPSLYVFRNEWKELQELTTKGSKLQGFTSGKILGGNFFYFQVFNEDDNEIRRVLYLI